MTFSRSVLFREEQGYHHFIEEVLSLRKEWQFSMIIINIRILL